MVAACDSDLVGQTFREGKKRLEVAEEFYGQEASEEEMLAALMGATIANLTGERVVQLAIDAGIVDGSCVLRIAGVPHAQMCKITG